MKKENNMLENLLRKTQIRDVKTTTFGKKIVFVNGYSLSVIQGCGRNCPETFEVAIIAPWGIDYTYTNGDTMNYQSQQEVIGIAKFVARLDLRIEEKAHSLKLSQQKYFELVYNS